LNLETRADALLLARREQELLVVLEESR
jgi:hypothetical protein